MSSLADDFQLFEEFLGSLESDRHRVYYRNGPLRDIELRHLAPLLRRLEHDGFVRQPNGLYLRHPLSPEIQGEVADVTTIEVGFTRRSDAHVHYNMTEGFRVTSGTGALYESTRPDANTFDKDRVRVVPLSVGREYVIRAGVPHAFRPDENGLNVFLLTNRVYSDREERCITPFDRVEFPPADCRDR